MLRIFRMQSLRVNEENTNPGPSQRPYKHSDAVIHSSQPLPPDGCMDPIEIMEAAARGEQDTVKDYSENLWSLYLTDTGGQLEFQELLPLLVSGPSIFFITFRLDQDLNQVFKIQYELPDGNKTHVYESSLTMLDSILQSLASISSMGTFVYDGLQEKDIPLRPKVFVVGTHKDKLNPEALSNEIKKIDQYLQEKITSTSHYREGLLEFSTPDQLIFTVNNLSEDDSDFKQIRSAVDNLVQRGEFKMSTPSHWLILSLVIRTLKEPIISFDQCLSVAQMCGITNTEELRHALHFLHTKLGVVRYFPDGGLEDLVVINPQVLFDKVTNLIVQTFTFKNAGKYLADEFRKKGIFSLTDFERVSNDSDPFLTPTCLVSLLKHLRIVARFQSGKGNTKYFIPCVLAHVKASTASSMEQKSIVPPLVVEFKCGYCPKGLPGALITYLQTNEMQSDLQWELQPDKIFRDQVSFCVAPDDDAVILGILPTNITISFIPNDQYNDTGRANSVEEVCSTVRQSLEKGIAKVASDMNYVYSAEHSITFDCPCDECCKDPYSPELRWNKGKPFRLRCRRTQKHSALPYGCMVWFGQPQAPSFPICTDTKPLMSSHQPIQSEKDTLNPTQLNKIFPLLLPIAYEWHNIGATLGVSDGELRCISKDCTTCNDCLREMLSVWLKQTDTQPTWQGLINAVKLFDLNLAQTITKTIK